MFEWNVEEMKLMNGKGVQKRNGKGMEFTVYDIEKEICREDKISFVDSYCDGNLSYILGLNEKFKQEEDTIKKDRYGAYNTTSLIAWCKRNDKKSTFPMVNISYHYGTIHPIFGCTRSLFDINRIGTYDFYDDYVDECFRRCLIEREKEEYQYFYAHDEYSILCKKINHRTHETTFGLNLCISDYNVYLCDENYEPRRTLTVEELKDLVEKYKQLDELAGKLTKETLISL